MTIMPPLSPSPPAVPPFWLLASVFPPEAGLAFPSTPIAWLLPVGFVGRPPGGQFEHTQEHEDQLHCCPKPQGRSWQQGCCWHTHLHWELLQTWGQGHCWGWHMHLHWESLQTWGQGHCWGWMEHMHPHWLELHIWGQLHCCCCWQTQEQEDESHLWPAGQDWTPLGQIQPQVLLLHTWGDVHWWKLEHSQRQVFWFHIWGQLHCSASQNYLTQPQVEGSCLYPWGQHFLPQVQLQVDQSQYCPEGQVLGPSLHLQPHAGYPYHLLMEFLQAHSSTHSHWQEVLL